MSCGNQTWVHLLFFPQRFTGRFSFPSISFIIHAMFPVDATHGGGIDEYQHDKDIDAALLRPPKAQLEAEEMGLGSAVPPTGCRSRRRLGTKGPATRPLGAGWPANTHGCLSCISARASRGALPIQVGRRPPVKRDRPAQGVAGCPTSARMASCSSSSLSMMASDATGTPLGRWPWR